LSLSWEGGRERAPYVRQQKEKRREAFFSVHHAPDLRWRRGKEKKEKRSLLLRRRKKKKDLDSAEGPVREGGRGEEGLSSLHSERGGGKRRPHYAILVRSAQCRGGKQGGKKGGEFLSGGGEEKKKKKEKFPLLCFVERGKKPRGLEGKGKRGREGCLFAFQKRKVGPIFALVIIER